MERMLVVVFDSQEKAYEAARELERLDEDSTIAVYAEAVVAKDREGHTTVTRTDDVDPQGTMGGTAVGSLIGLLGGPAGLAAGTVIGFVVGATADVARARVGRDFVADVTSVLRPGKVAVVAEIDEESTIPVDGRMDALGGVVFRRALSDVTDSAYEHEIGAIEADIAQAKSDFAVSRAEQKAKLQARIDSLNAKLHEAREQLKVTREAIQRDAAAKITHLNARAAGARADVKARHVERVNALKARYNEWLDEMASRTI
jgi:uncharacterized membrane protein